MKFNKLKRKAFFWVEKLQISRNERIGVVLLMGIIIVLLFMSLFLQSSFNYNQQEYDEVLAEFEKRSALLKQEEKQLAEKYNPQPTVTSTEEPTHEPAVSTKTMEPETAEAVPDTININTANAELLQALDGIGPAYAQNIIDYREANGPFKTADDLLNVKGIGEKRLENIRPFIKFEN